MWVLVLATFSLIGFAIFGLCFKGVTNEDKIMEWLKEQGYENVEVQYAIPRKQFMYNMHEVFFPADFYDVICEKHGSIEKKIIRVKFRSISDFDSNKIFK